MGPDSWLEPQFPILLHRLHSNLLSSWPEVLLGTLGLPALCALHWLPVSLSFHARFCLWFSLARLCSRHNTTTT